MKTNNKPQEKKSSISFSAFVWISMLALMFAFVASCSSSEDSIARSYSENELFNLPDCSNVEVTQEEFDAAEFVILRLVNGEYTPFPDSVDYPVNRSEYNQLSAEQFSRGGRFPLDTYADVASGGGTDCLFFAPYTAGSSDPVDPVVTIGTRSTSGAYTLPSEMLRDCNALIDAFGRNSNDPSIEHTLIRDEFINNSYVTYPPGQAYPVNTFAIRNILPVPDDGTDYALVWELQSGVWCAQYIAGPSAN